MVILGASECWRRPLVNSTVASFTRALSTIAWRSGPRRCRKPFPEMLKLLLARLTLVTAATSKMLDSGRTVTSKLPLSCSGVPGADPQPLHTDTIELRAVTT